MENLSSNFWIIPLYLLSNLSFLFNLVCTPCTPLLAKKKKQSPNFIFDITECPLSAEEIERQINGLYSSHHTRFIEKIVVMKDGKIEKVYMRK